MTALILDCEQGSADWFAARMGIPTASEFKTVMAKGEGKTRRAYMLKLAGEIITGEPMESYSNGNMERGKIKEAEARQLYEFAHDVELKQVGFIRNGNKGCSPDALIGDTGLLELKSAAAHVLIELLDKDAFPPEHKAQCQGALLVAEREFVDLGVYCPKLPLFERRVTRDEKYIAELSAEVDRFNDELAALVEKINRYGMKEAA